MSVTTLEAIIVEDGQIKLLDPFELPEKTRVYVVVPGVTAPAKAVFRSPRLAHPEQALHFIKEVIREPQDASLRK